jgi:hypothetical protein
MKNTVAAWKLSNVCQDIFRHNDRGYGVPERGTQKQKQPKEKAAKQDQS